MKVFVTGGTGLLGWNVVQALRARGDAVDVLVRRPDAREILGPDVGLVRGDLRDVPAFEDRLAGADVLVHAGACYGEYYRGGSPEAVHATNVRGTAALLEAAARAGIRDVVVVSSSAVLDTAGGGAVNEDAPYPPRGGDPYFASKIDAEREVVRFLAAHPEVRVVRVLPTVMLGPGDRGPTPTGSFVLRLLDGKIPFVLPGWHRIVDARDVAAAVLAAAERGARGARYLVGGRRYEVAELYRTLTEVTGTPTPTRRISPRRLLLASRVMALGAALTGRRPLLSPAIVRRLQEAHVYDSSRAERELGVRFRPLAATLADFVAWSRAAARRGAQRAA